MGIWRVSEKNDEMVQGGGDVGIGLIAYVREVDVGTADVKVNVVAMEELVWCVLHWIAEGTDFHGIGHCCFG